MTRRSSTVHPHGHGGRVRRGGPGRADAAHRLAVRAWVRLCGHELLPSCLGCAGGFGRSPESGRRDSLVAGLRLVTCAGPGRRRAGRRLLGPSGRLPRQVEAMRTPARAPGGGDGLQQTFIYPDGCRRAAGRLDCLEPPVTGQRGPCPGRRRDGHARQRMASRSVVSTTPRCRSPLAMSVGTVRVRISSSTTVRP